MNIVIHKFVGATGRQALHRFGGLGEKHVQSLDRLLLAAGQPGGITGVDLFGFQVLCAAILPLVGAYIFTHIQMLDFLFQGPKQVLVYVALVIFGFFFPMMNIREQVVKRQKSIALQLPDTLDLLTISVEAGLDFMSALRRVVEKHRPGPLKEELTRFFQETELGRARRVALREMANRVQLSDLNAVASALIQADQLGVSLAPILRAQSDMLRIRRGQRAEKAAQEAPVKMLAPLMICILPSVFIMILGPIILRMLMDVAR